MSDSISVRSGAFSNRQIRRLQKKRCSLVSNSQSPKKEDCQHARLGLLSDIFISFDRILAPRVIFIVYAIVYAYFFRYFLIIVDFNIEFFDH